MAGIGVAETGVADIGGAPGSPSGSALARRIMPMAAATGCTECGRATGGAGVAVGSADHLRRRHALDG